MLYRTPGNHGCVRISLLAISQAMQQSVEAPTPKALADLVARCDQINRFAMQLTAVEENRIAALAAGDPRDAAGARPSADRRREAPDAPGAHPALGAHGRSPEGSGDAGDPRRARSALPRRARAGEGAVAPDVARPVALGDALEERRAQDPSRHDDGVPRAAHGAGAEAGARRGARAAGEERGSDGDVRAARRGAEVARATG